MQSNTTRKANPAGAVNADGALHDNNEAIVAALKHTAVCEGLQEELEATTSLSVAYGRFVAHPAKMTTTQLNREEQEVSRFIAKLADILATLDRRRRALVSERSYRVNMPASARIERARILTAA